MLTKDERETVIRTDEASDSWTVYTSSLSMFNKLSKLADPVRVVKGSSGKPVAWEFKLDMKSVHLRKPPAPRKAHEKVKESLAKAREAKKGAKQ